MRKSFLARLIGLFLVFFLALAITIESGAALPTAQDPPPPPGTYTVEIDPSETNLANIPADEDDVGEGSSVILPPGVDQLIEIPVPVAEAPLEEPRPEDPGDAVVHYSDSGLEEIFPSANVESPGGTMVSGLPPGLPQDLFETTLGPDNFSALSLVASPEIYPWRVNVRLFIHFPNFPDGSYGGCSGVLIDSKFVLAAGHCVHTWESDGGNGCEGTDTHCWADEILVYPAYENGALPYGGARDAELWSKSGWTVDHNFSHDMGYIILDRHVGALTGWHGFGYNNADSFFEDNYFYNPGYPGESPYDGELMYTWDGTYDNVTANTLYIERASFRGQSGSGTYDIDSSSYYVYAVQSHNSCSSSDCDAGQTRLTSYWYSDIDGKIDEKTPASVDLVALDVNVLADSIPEGSNISSMDYLIHNYSEVSYNGTVYVGVYMSTNDYISTGDVLLQSHSVPNVSLPPKGSTRVTVTSPPKIPFPTTSGTRYIGVILDIADANTGNNDSSYWDADETYIINCNKPAAPSPVSPANWSYTQDRTPPFDWTSTTYSDNYNIWVDNHPADWANLVINVHSGSSDYTPFANLADGAYAWSTRGHDTTSGCNIYSDWSTTWVLTVDATDPINATNAWSTDGHSYYSWSNDPTIAMTWTGDSDATSGVKGYGISWTTSSTSRPTEVIDSYTNNHAGSFLSDGSSWYFHLITVDNAGNWTDGTFHRGPYYIDTVDPLSWMNGLLPSQTSTSILLNWGGSDDASGVDDYYVQYRVGSGGTWTTWMGGTSLTSATFGPAAPVAVEVGQTYYFRSAVEDWAGNISPYSGGDGDTQTTIVTEANYIYLPLVIE
ncbi:hypothetical protein ACFLZW_04700 [Chloroflexota bacterium]